MKALTARQAVQEEGYEFPYHYIPHLENGQFAQTRSLAWGYEYLSYLHFVLDEVAKVGFDSLLDVGCGDGRFLHELRRTRTASGLTGIDYSPRAIDLARALNQDVEWICGDVGGEGVVRRSYDIITLIETLEHIQPDGIASFLQGIRRCLKEDGRFIVTVPSKNIKVSAKHYQHFDRDSIEQCLSPYFQIIDMYYVNRKRSLRLKLMKLLLSNRVYILNNKVLLNALYACYTKHLFHVKEHNCRRLIAVCRKASNPA